jgi:protein arginine kinase activator
MAERPVECSQCKKPIKLLYKEIVGESILCTEMCADCPVLLQKLHGQPTAPLASNNAADREAGVCCGNCRTTLESVKMGNPLGCSECYAIFSDVLTNDLINADKIPSRLAAKKSQPLHLGKSPAKPLTIPSSSRLTALNEALNEALKKENYEQAAWLRDQIKALMEKGANDGKN